MIFNISKIYNKLYRSRESSKDAILYIWSFKFAKFYLAFFLLGHILIWLLVIKINSSISQDLIILHYNVDFGNDLVGSAKKLFIIPALSFVIFLINFSLLTNFSRGSHFRFVAHLLLSSCIFVNFFLLSSLASIYLVNFR